ncbi:MAG: hypothetical protein GC160_28485 [Acidobacteria bacterium]|nr:hypothetical protein [Acidobacteriota bacterium]
MHRLALRATVVWTAAATLFAAEAERKAAPRVADGGVVNAAGFDNGPGGFVAPGSIVAIFGEELAGRAQAVRADDISGLRLPLSLANVSVIIGEQLAPLYYVSPNQVNCQVPGNLRPRDAPYQLLVLHSNEASASAPLLIRPAAPGLFPVVAHQDFSIVGRGEGLRPAHPGELIVLFGAGFGPTKVLTDNGQIARAPEPIALPAKVLLNDVEVAPERVLYVGVTTGYAGLYQVNLLLPEDLAPGDVTAIVEVDGVRSPVGVEVAVEPSPDP